MLRALLMTACTTLRVMPAFSEDVISDEKLDALEAYLLALGGHDAGEEMVPSR